MRNNYFEGYISGDKTLLRNLKISDSEYQSESKDYYKLAKDIEAVYDDFIEELDNISKLLDGKFADNIMKYKENIQFYLDGVITDIYADLKRSMSSYIDKIDRADGKLF